MTSFSKVFDPVVGFLWMVLGMIIVDFRMDHVMFLPSPVSDEALRAAHSYYAEIPKLGDERYEFVIFGCIAIAAISLLFRVVFLRKGKLDWIILFVSVANVYPFYSVVMPEVKRIKSLNIYDFQHIRPDLQAHLEHVALAHGIIAVVTVTNLFLNALRSSNVSSAVSPAIKGEKKEKSG